MKKKDNGITLIALVITIVVLLILTTITIRTITKDKTLEKAKDTRESMINLQEDTNRDMHSIYDIVTSTQED